MSFIAESVFVNTFSQVFFKICNLSRVKHAASINIRFADTTLVVIEAYQGKTKNNVYLLMTSQ